MKFIYVMDRTSKQKLEDRGYTLLKSDEENMIWVFENREETAFELGFDCQCVFSDVLTF